MKNSLSLPKCIASRYLNQPEVHWNGISGKAGKGLADFAQLIADLTKMQEFVTLTDLIEEVMTKSGYITALEQAHTMEADARIDNMREFLSVAKEFFNTLISDTAFWRIHHTSETKVIRWVH